MILILLSPTVSGLQCMLDKCSDVATQLDLQFDVSKSHCIVFGKLYRKRISDMSLSEKLVQWFDNLVSSKGIKFNIDPFKRAFYVACNLIFTARCYASVVYAMALCPSVSVGVSHKSVFH